MKTTGKLIIFVFTLWALAASAYAADVSPLFKAVKKGDKAEVEALLAKGADVNAKGPYGYTPLHWAAHEGRKDLAELLLTKGADVNAKDEYGGTPLHMAVHEGKKDVAELLLTKGADVNAKSTKGYTPLHTAAYEGKKDVAELLLTKGADVNAKDKYGDTPLHLAVSARGGKDVAELLLTKGADVTAKNQEGDMASLRLPDDNEYVLKQDRFKAEDRHRQAKLLEEDRLGRERLMEGGRLKLLEDHIKSNPRAAFLELTTLLKDKPTDYAVRRLIIKLASELKPAPAIPEEARKHFVEGAAINKLAKTSEQQVLAAQSFTEALKIAPWWGDAYYNLGVTQELAEKYDEAELAFYYYLLSNPNETEEREVQDRIYGLSAKRKLAGVK